MTNQIKTLLIIFSFLIIASCDNDEPPPAKSSEKKITSFKFSGLTPEVTATINETARTIAAIVPAGTDVTVLVPTIAISEKATVSPASGAAQNFSSAVTYTVTAEDNTTQTYQVTVTVEEPAPTFTIDPYEGSLVIERTYSIYIYGTGFGDKENNSVTFIDQADQSEFEGQLNSESSTTQLVIRTDSDFPLGDYKIRLSIGGESVLLDEVFTIIARQPEIWTLDPDYVKPGEAIIMDGFYFAESGNIVKLKNSSHEYDLSLEIEGKFFIRAILPMDVEPGYYTVSVTAYGREGTLDTPIRVLSLTDPVILSVENPDLALGETLVILGANLKKDGAVTNINFLPAGGGTTIVRTGLAGSDGSAVQFDIPLDFPEGSYIIIVEVDGEFSNEYETVNISAP